MALMLELAMYITVSACVAQEVMQFHTVIH